MLLTLPATVEFDPSKKAHRDAVRAFMVRHAWVDSPIRFAYDPAYGSIAAQVQTKLLQWYMDKEAGVAKKPTTRS